MEKKSDLKDNSFALGRNNYILIIIGVCLILLGFILMAGGGSDDPTKFNPDIFSFRRITLAPILIVGGFVFEVYAIMHHPDKPLPFSKKKKIAE